MEIGQLPGWRNSDDATRAFLIARERDFILALRARRRQTFGRAAVGQRRRSTASPRDKRPGCPSPACPHCPSRRVHRWGCFGTPPRQRWKCLGCGRTFSDLSGTPLQGTRKLAAWIAFAGHLRRVPTVRAAAAAVGVNKDTALRWRHRMLDGLAEAERTAGSRDRVDTRPELTFLMTVPMVGRAARAAPGEPHAAFIAWILLGGVPRAPDPDRDPEGPTFSRVVTVRRERYRPGTLPPRPGMAVYRAMVRAPVRSETVTTTPAELLALRVAAAERGWRVLTPGKWNEYHAPIRRLVRGLWRFRGAFRSWKTRFRGIAPENLQRYLDWFGALGGLREGCALPFTRFRALLSVGAPRRGGEGPHRGE